MTWDLLIRRGLVIDGSGKPGVIADLAVAGAQIAALGIAVHGDAKKIIDADGLAVTPGFIDIKRIPILCCLLIQRLRARSGRESQPKSSDIVVSRSRRCCPERRSFWPII